MFALLVSIISIALVVALGLATLYYGGSASAQAATRAVATSLISEASQIEGAGVIAVAQGDDWPQGSPNFALPYLTSMPVPPSTAYVVGKPSGSDWAYYVPGGATHHFVLKNKITANVCMEVNRSQGLIGIPATWTGTNNIQCFGPGVPSGPDNSLAYTFFYVPVGTTAGQNAQALAQTLVEGVTASTPTVSPGYPRLCPDGTSINSGVCVDTAGSLAAVSVAPPPPTDGFGDLGGGWGNSSTGGGLGATISCSGTSTNTHLTATCSLANTMDTPIILNSANGYSSPDGPLTSTNNGCVGTTIGAGATCTFTVDADVPSTPEQAPVITIEYGVGPTGTEGLVDYITPALAWDQSTGPGTAGYMLVSAAPTPNFGDAGLTDLGFQATCPSDGKIVGSNVLSSSFGPLYSPNYAELNAAWQANITTYCIPAYSDEYFPWQAVPMIKIGGDAPQAYSASANAGENVYTSRKFFHTRQGDFTVAALSDGWCHAPNVCTPGTSDSGFSGGTVLAGPGAIDSFVDVAGASPVLKPSLLRIDGISQRTFKGDSTVVATITGAGFSNVSLYVTAADGTESSITQDSSSDSTLVVEIPPNPGSAGLASITLSNIDGTKRKIPIQYLTGAPPPPPSAPTCGNPRGCMYNGNVVPMGTPMP